MATILTIGRATIENTDDVVALVGELLKEISIAIGGSSRVVVELVSQDGL